MLLWWNRQTRLVRFGCTRSREIWVHADLPVAAIDERALDRLLGLVVEALSSPQPLAERLIVLAVGPHAGRQRRVLARLGGAPVFSSERPRQKWA